MELQDFVAESLKQIISGVKTAQEYGSGVGAKVNPLINPFSDYGPKVLATEDGELAQEIKFDVAVTTTKGTSTKGGIGVFVGSVGLGSQGKSDAESSSISRIKFSVPLVLPQLSK